jgi:hypothetical protein
LDANGLDVGVFTGADIGADTEDDEVINTGADPVGVDALGNGADVTIFFELEVGFEATVEGKFDVELVGVGFKVHVEARLEVETSVEMGTGDVGRVAESERSAERSVAADTVHLNTCLDLELDVEMAVDAGFETEAE